MKKAYVVGFAFGPGKRVALIKKTKPEWQAGLFNGVGGKVEDFDDDIHCAMVREFEEETGVKTFIKDWHLYLEIATDKSHVSFFTTRLSDEQFKSLQSITEEQVVARFYDSLNWKECLPNLRWVVPMATMARYIGDVVNVVELSEERAV
jgi:8-oxo-dGTP pyrophosphatase MutT (NUDIX family)